MPFEMQDRFSFGDAANIRITNDGYLVATPRIARTGIQLYRGSEVGRPDLAVVRVLRSEDEVFKDSAMHSMAHRPITDDHPKEMVTADNWAKYSKGQSGGEVARDGEFIRVPMAVMDAKVIKKIKDGKAELSVGYSCEIHWENGEFNGQTYDALQKDIKGNHIAVVDAARGGDLLRIGDGTGLGVDMSAIYDACTRIAKGEVNKSDDLKDGQSLSIAKEGHKGYPFMKDGFVYMRGLQSAMTDAAAANDADVVSAASSLLRLIEDQTKPLKQPEKGKTMKQKIIDGISVEVSDVAEQVIDRHIKTLMDNATTATAALAALQTKYDADIKVRDTQIATLTTEKATTDAKVTTLEQQVKDAQLSPAAIDQLVKDRAEIVGKAKAVIGDKLVVDGKSAGDMMKQVVTAKIGDAAAKWNDDQVKASFDTLTANVQTTTGNIGDQKNAFTGTFTAQPGSQAALDAAYDLRDKKLEDAWKTGGVSTAQ